MQTLRMLWPLSIGASPFDTCQVSIRIPKFREGERPVLFPKSLWE